MLTNLFVFLTRYTRDQSESLSKEFKRTSSPTRDSLTRVERRLLERTAPRRFPYRERTIESKTRTTYTEST